MLIAIFNEALFQDINDIKALVITDRSWLPASETGHRLKSTEYKTRHSQIKHRGAFLMQNGIDLGSREFVVEKKSF
jgi:hypothetical protein